MHLLLFLLLLFLLPLHDRSTQFSQTGYIKNKTREGGNKGEVKPPFPFLLPPYLINMPFLPPRIGEEKGGRKDCCCFCSEYYNENLVSGGGDVGDDVGGKKERK